MKIPASSGGREDFLHLSLGQLRRKAFPKSAAFLLALEPLSCAVHISHWRLASEKVWAGLRSA
jgi:hypothetical protein